MFESATQKLPESLRTTVDLSQWSERLAQLELPEKFAESMVKVWVMSEFATQHCDRRPEILIELCQSGDLFKSYGEATYR